MSNLIPTKNDLWFLPLGGANEIGMNLNLFGHDGQWLMVDCGIGFYDKLGIDVVTPDPTFIAEHKDNLIGLVLTHAHEDHVGAVPYIWPYLRCPIYATPFTAAITRQKIAEKSWAKEVQIIEIPLSGNVKIGSFDIEFITLTHSIPEPNALAIKTPHGTIVHTGDWKIDPEPLIGDLTDQDRLVELGNAGVLAMVCDSTNVFTEGSSGSEADVRKELTRLISEHPNQRISVACFASNVARLETAALAAKETGRKVVLLGRSLHRMVDAARQAGYLKGLPEFIDPRDANRMKDSDVLIICTGSQGEPRSALARMATKTHPDIQLGMGDVVFFSSRVIPGNEKSIGALQNALIKSGVKLITSYEEDIHVSGHPARDELRQMYKWVRPRVVIPVHGEPRHLYEQANLARQEGIKETIIPENGSLIQIEPGNTRILETIPTGRWGYDGNRMVPMNSPIVKERFKLSSQGAVVATITIDSFGQMLRPPHLSIFGLCNAERELELLNRDIFKALRDALTGDYKNDDARNNVLNQIIRQTFNRRFDKKPVVDVHVVMASSS